MSANSSHWCKAVIEEVVQPVTGAPPPPNPPSYYGSVGTGVANNYLPTSYGIGTTSKPTVQTSIAGVGSINPQYLQMYQQYYQSASPTPSPVINNLNMSNSFSMPYSYQQVLTSNINSNSNNSSNSINNGSINSNIPYSNTGNSLYNHATAPTATYSSNSAWSAYQATAGLPTQYITQPAASPANGTNKKPNVSRFSAPISNAEQSTATSKTADKQPASLKDFVKRSFAMCSSDAERTYVSTELQKLISKVTADGRLHVHKWEFEPTPKYVPPESVSSSSFNASTVLSSSRTSSAQPPAELSKKEKKRRSRFESTDKASQQTATFVVNDNETKKKPVLAGVEKLATTEELKMRESRANRFQVASNVNANSTTGRQKRRKSQVTVRVPVKADSSITSAEFDIESLKIVGTCEKLEKDYLRLTSPPDPSVVRPEHVLRKTIQLLKKKWSNEEVDYVYMCSQLKSIRQDLTVQHIQNTFTVHVYETHARVALESNDLNEYNQCQTQLKQLYVSGIQGSEMEFTAYRILYYVYLLGNKKYKAGSSDISHTMAALSPEARSDPAVQHALKVRQAIQSDNYNRFFKLYANTPNMGIYILDLIADSQRVYSLQRICKGYKPNVPVDFIVTQLGFDDKEVGKAFLTKVGCVLVPNPEGVEEFGELAIDTKESVIDLSKLFTQEKLLL